MLARVQTAEDRRVDLRSDDDLGPDAGGRDRVECALVRHRPALLRFAKRLTGDAETADDLVQQTSLRALERAEQFVGRGSIEGWLCMILRNTYLMALRSRRNDEELGCLELVENEDIVDSVYRLELHEQVSIQLSPEEQLLVEAFYGRQLSVREVATMTGWTVSAVKCRLYRLRQRVAQLSQWES